MTNIPTELLRTLVLVADVRSFTKAAQTLGVSQPSVSAHIKRLQAILGNELLDRSAPGVNLTEAGQAVLDHARRLLSLNDRILDLAAPDPAASPLRIGIPGGFAGAFRTSDFGCAATGPTLCSGGCVRARWTWPSRSRIPVR